MLACGNSTRVEFPRNRIFFYFFFTVRRMFWRGALACEATIFVEFSAFRILDARDKTAKNTQTQTLAAWRRLGEAIGVLASPFRSPPYDASSLGEGAPSIQMPIFPLPPFSVLVLRVQGKKFSYSSALTYHQLQT